MLLGIVLIICIASLPSLFHLQLPTRQPTPRPTKSPTLPPTPAPTTAEPTGPHVFGVTCSTAGQRSQQCGAAAVGGGGNGRPKACCPGFTCDPRYPGRCIVDPDWVAPTPKPTKKVSGRMISFAFFVHHIFARLRHVSH